MGYFSNGTEGMDYEGNVCCKCFHQDKEGGCPVWNLHLDYNSEECNKEDSFLHALIPIRKDGINGICKMYADKLLIKTFKKSPTPPLFKSLEEEILTPEVET